MTKTIIEDFSWNSVLDKMSEVELRDLNRIVVEKLNFYSRVKNLSEISKFSRGDEVFFEKDDGEKIFGKIIRINQKTVTIISEQNIQWRVSPQFLKKVLSN